MDKNVFFRVVVPLIEVQDTALICISTPLKKANFYSELCNLEMNGKPVFNVLHIKLEPCEMCKRRMERSRNQKDICSHMLTRLPPWKDGEKHEMVKQMFEQVGRGGDYDRESRGLVRDDGDGYFSSGWIDNFEKRSPYTSERPPKQIIVSCDPNGGGISSDTAIISAYYEHGRMVICGIDAHPTKFDQKKKLLYAHLQALRQVPRFRFSEIVFVPENNLDDAANMLIETARTFENVRIYADKKSLQEGAKTKPWSKIKYTVSALHYLSPTDGCVYFDKELVCANPYAEHRETRANDTKKKLFHQLRQWKTLVYAGKTAKESVYITCSGKTDDSGRLVIGQKDDLAMAFVMNAYMNTQVNL